MLLTMMPAATPTTSRLIMTSDVLGHPTDFLIEQQRTGDSITIKVTTVLPAGEWDGQALRTFKPPRFPWTGLTG